MFLKWSGDFFYNLFLDFLRHLLINNINHVIIIIRFVLLRMHPIRSCDGLEILSGFSYSFPQNRGSAILSLSTLYSIKLIFTTGT